MNTILNLTLAACLTLGAVTARAQDADTGWLEGTVVDAKGKPVWVYAYVAPLLKITAVSAAGKSVDGEPRTDMGGFYSMKGLRPGVYEVTIPATKNDQGKYRPQRIQGVIVKPGVRTMLNIVVQEGEQFQEVARGVATEQALIVAQELARLARQVDQLQRQIEAVQKQLADLKK